MNKRLLKIKRMTRMKSARTCIIAVLCLVALCACKKPALNKEQEDAYKDAILSLKKLQAASQVGVNIQQYPPLLIDAKARVNIVCALLSDGELKDDLLKVMDAYTDVAVLWRHKVENTYSGDTVSANEDPWKNIISKYSIPTEAGLIYTGAGEPPTPGVHVDKSMSLIWSKADLYLSQTEETYRRLTK